MRLVLWRGALKGTSSNVIAFGLSGLATSLMGGFMIGSVGFRLFFLVTAIVTLAGVAIFWFSFPQASYEEQAYS